MYVRHLTVEPTWFEDWCDYAQDTWEDFQVTFDDGYRDVLVPAMAAADLGIPTTIFVSAAHVGGVFPYAPYEMATLQELVYARDRGVEIGGHGHQHLDMRKMSSIQLVTEIQLMERVLGEFELKSMAPPHGHYDKRLVELLGPRYTVYGTGIFPAGHWGTVKRIEANMDGFFGEDGIEVKWPWE